MQNKEYILKSMYGSGSRKNINCDDDSESVAGIQFN